VGGGTATIGNEILNLVKNIVGSGGLSLPAGIAAFGSAPTAVPVAASRYRNDGILNAYSFHFWAVFVPPHTAEPIKMGGIELLVDNTVPTTMLGSDSS
jgi:hypothetical protein